MRKVDRIFFIYDLRLIGGGFKIAVDSNPRNHKNQCNRLSTFPEV